MLRINNIKITNIGPIKDLSLNFDPKFNIICGANGIGKTTILDCLAQAFSLQQISLKKMVGSEFGEWTVNGSFNEQLFSQRMRTTSSSPIKNSLDSHGLYLRSDEVIVFKTHRNVIYQQLSTVSTDKVKEIGAISNETVHGTNSSDIKNWFVNRHLWSVHKDHLSDIQLKNLEIAKMSFSLLNPNISFKKVEPATNDILLNTAKGEIVYEYLSSGYKSCIAVLLGLIKEIEIRFKTPNIFVGDFDGIIFIDELDLHLHPEWQARIYIALKEVLPNAQIFTSTHSPHIIQVAGANEIIPLILDENLDVNNNPLVNDEFGCQGWTVEEILKDVMAMSETRTVTYLEAVNGFNTSLDQGQKEKAEFFFLILDKMLHPESSLRKILRIQLTGLQNND